jgi:hypothetical protein
VSRDGPQDLRAAERPQPRTLDELGKKEAAATSISLTQSLRPESLLIALAHFRGLLHRSCDARGRIGRRGALAINRPWSPICPMGVWFADRPGVPAAPCLASPRTGRRLRGARWGRGKQDRSYTRSRRFTCLQLIAAGDRTKAAITFMRYGCSWPDTDARGRRQPSAPIAYQRTCRGRARATPISRRRRRDLADGVALMKRHSSAKTAPVTISIDRKRSAAF